MLLVVAAVATSWSSYQATRWNGEQAAAAGRTNAIRIEASRADGLAEAQTQIDVATFIAWAEADVTGDRKLADFCWTASATSSAPRSTPGTPRLH